MADDVTNNEVLKEFLEERSKFEIPDNYVTWVRQLAEELAIGVHKGLWPGGFHTAWGNEGITIDDNNIVKFGLRRWNLKDWTQTLERLHGTGYIVNRPNQYVTITRDAFDLLQEAAPYNIFISYRRKDSSAFALLVSLRLKQFNLVPFVDMALEPGGNWHADLEDRIKGCDYFIILLGKDTLASDMTVKEVCWAIDSNKTIIPIWHNEFGNEADFDLRRFIVQLAANWNDENLDSRISDVRDVIQQTNAIRVTDESASGYNTAIVELLNRFGITP